MTNEKKELFKWSVWNNKTSLIINLISKVEIKNVSLVTHKVIYMSMIFLKHFKWTNV